MENLLLYRDSDVSSAASSIHGVDTSLHTQGWLHHGEGRWEEEGKGRAGSKFGLQESMQRQGPSSMPLGQAWEQRDPASCLRLWILPCSQIVRRRAGKGVQELSDVVSSVTPLNKAHLPGRQRIQQDFCRPDCECCCQGFTISTNKHAGAAFGTTSSNTPA